MRFVREYHRLLRAILFMVILCGIVMAWVEMVNPTLLDLATFGEFVTVFILIGVAGLVTHRLARWVAPAEKGQVDEDSEEIVTGPDKPDF